MSLFGKDELSKYLPKSLGFTSKSTRSESLESNNDEEAEDHEAAKLRAMLPTSFGLQKKTVITTDAFEKTRRKEGDTTHIKQEITEPEIKRIKDESGQSSPAKYPVKMAEYYETDSDDNESLDDEEIFDTLPISHEIKLHDHFKTVSALTLDPSGARLISGGYDFDTKFWDFAGMDASLRPFRSIKPCGDHQIHHLEYSTSGDSFLIISGSARAKLYDRDGFEIEEYVKGDPYIRDMRNTVGHIASLTSGGWHPHDKQTFFTASADSTIRIWDVENKRKQKQIIVYKSKERGGRSSVTAVTMNHDAKLIAGAAQDGQLCLWPVNGPYLRPSHSIEKAHLPYSETSCILFSRNNWTVVTRGGDDTVKIWDTRNFKKVVSQVNDLPTLNPETNIIFSPDERLLLTGTATKKGAGYGKLLMLDKDSLQPVRTMNITQSTVVRVLWHSKINQIITGSADGSVHVFYDPNTSVRGAKLCVSRTPKKRAVDDYDLERPIIAPHSLNLPVSGPGKGGKIGSSLTQHIMKELIKDTTRDEDPRAVLLRYARISEEDPKWVGKAYERTQPKKILAETTGEEDQEEVKRRR
ncbi:4681_t:CDS:10 [Paraglomus brasilianum]|uniref:4681_t:CDS:1 n=1 Tax=Paraglomus brasilianum TaxID=144538 RepID=A0A9N9GIQ3_9GLOM|nr:4681_t:CDS:10 [Paraglomus brasilianum]